ncbi:hypothetical protein GlitD10_1933 [Gloeomargarita lithophora Alchichica-D10]|uniref:Uncharacterized protein n=2 Tax=Gloeomargarita TaxID=1188227 RepID=A0A1J0AED4_9CYAN|nr:hypothetical protein GlitD10_1933 [Gloeomargarita lithophora Alchichica-D10]
MYHNPKDDAGYDGVKVPPGLAVKDTTRLRLLFYLLPVVGLVPAVGNLLTNWSRSPVERDLSRSVITITSLWLVTYVLGGSLAQQESLGVPALLMSSVATSGYFILQLWLMVRVWRGQSLKLPGVTRLARRLP